MSVLNKYQDIPVRNLQVNPENARHDEMISENEAINWLVDNLRERMKKLSQDIVDKGFVYDPPLVRKENDRWKVYDGNRRVACLKLIHNPSIAEDEKIRSFYEKLASSYQGTIPESAHCRIEDDMKVINDILERRHAGGDSGIGQMAWGPEGKDNFSRRTGSPYHKPKFGTELSRVLKEKGVVKKDEKTPVSIFDRLLSNEKYRNMVGISFKNRELNFLCNEQESLNVIKRIIDDNRIGNINLNKAWSQKEKDNYFLHLKNENVLPTNKKEGSETGNTSINNSSAKNTRPKKVKPYERPTLIPQNIRLNLSGENTSRLKNVFIELQYDLFFSKHTNAIAVMFRVLVEMCVDHYIDNHKIVVKTKKKRNPSLSEKFDSCLSDMVSQSLISSKDRSVLIKFKQPEPFLSADTFNAYVHHRYAHPSQSDLIAKWNALEPFITICLGQNKSDTKSQAA